MKAAHVTSMTIAALSVKHKLSYQQHTCEHAGGKLLHRNGCNALSRSTGTAHVFQVHMLVQSSFPALRSLPFSGLLPTNSFLCVARRGKQSDEKAAHSTTGKSFTATVQGKIHQSVYYSKLHFVIDVQRSLCIQICNSHAGCGA